MLATCNSQYVLPLMKSITALHCSLLIDIDRTSFASDKKGQKGDNSQIGRRFFFTFPWLLVATHLRATVSVVIVSQHGGQ
jgi:hypothetical protein